MSRILLVTIFSLICSACASTSQGSNGFHFNALKKINLGEGRSKVIEVLGQPSASEASNEGTLLTYSIPYKGLELPKVLIFIDLENRVTSKSINLFEIHNDNFKLEESDRIVGKGQFVQKTVPEKKSHYFSAEREYVDEARGISLTVNAAKENQVKSIDWSSPSKPSNMITDGHK